MQNGYIFDSVFVLMTTLNITTRTDEKKPDQLRAEGFVPAVFYGKKEKSTPIIVEKSDFLKALKEAGESTVISLKQEGEDDIEVLIHDIQLDPLTEEPLHVDFYAFERGVALEMEIPLVFVGISPAVKNLGGTLVKVIHELPIKALPKNLPHNIEVDISSLVDFESNIVAKEVILPEGVELDVDPDEVVATVDAPHEEEPEETTEIDMSAVEVEGEKKEEETEEEKKEE